MHIAIIVAVTLAGAVIMTLSLAQMRICGDFRSSLTLTAFSGAALLLSQFEIRYVPILTSTVVSSALALVLLALSAVFVPPRNRRDIQPRSVRVSTGLLVMLAAWLWIVDLARAPDPTVLKVITRLLSVLALLIVVHICRSGMARQEHIALLIAFVFGFACIATAVSAQPFSACTQFKCGALGGQLAGAFSSSNSLAIVASLAVLSAFAIGHRRLQWLLWIVGAGVVYAANARTELLALCCAFVGALIWRRFSKRSGVGRSVFAVLLPIAGLSIGLYLVYSARPTDFSDRGGIWIVGRTALGSSWLLGRGLDAWSVEALNRNYMHSQYLFLLFSGGAVALVLYTVALCALGLQLARTDDWLRAAFLLFVVVDGLTEVEWNLIAFEATTIIGMLLIWICHTDDTSSTSQASRGKTPAVLPRE